MKNIILHHSLTKDGKVVDFDAICNYHQSLGWEGPCGYHEVIELVNGVPTHFKGRSLHTRGAHTYGANENTIGICIVGNFDIEAPTKEIIDYLYQRLDVYRGLYGSIYITGHCDHPHPKSGYTKTCPGELFPLNEVKAKYNNPPHWADESYNYLTQSWVDNLEKRYDEKMTRGELFSLLERILKKIDK